MNKDVDILDRIRARSEKLPPPKSQMPIECAYFILGVAVACMMLPPLFR